MVSRLSRLLLLPGRHDTKPPPRSRRDKGGHPDQDLRSCRCRDPRTPRSQMDTPLASSHSFPASKSHFRPDGVRTRHVAHTRASRTRAPSPNPTSTPALDRHRPPLPRRAPHQSRPQHRWEPQHKTIGCRSPAQAGCRSRLSPRHRPPSPVPIPIATRRVTVRPPVVGVDRVARRLGVSRRLITALRPPDDAPHIAAGREEHQREQDLQTFRRHGVPGTAAPRAWTPGSAQLPAPSRQGALMVAQQATGRATSPPYFDSPPVISGIPSPPKNTPGWSPWRTLVRCTRT